MKLYKHVYNTKTKIDTIEFEVTESPKLYTVVDKNIIHSVWEKKIKKEDIGVFRGTSLFSYNMITTTPDPTPFIKALINREENYEKHLKVELDDCVHRRAQFLKLLKEDDFHYYRLTPSIYHPEQKDSLLGIAHLYVKSNREPAYEEFLSYCRKNTARTFECVLIDELSGEEMIKYVENLDDVLIVQ